ncbi:beta-1,3-galactosyltransferase brn-like [Styela clava]
MVNPVKASIAIATLVSTITLIGFIRYRYIASRVKLPTENEYKPRKIDWEYFKSLPNRFAASYYPQKQTHKNAIIEPILKNEADGKFNVTFIIYSTPENSARRQLVRNTWGSIKNFNGVNLFRIFVVGITEDSNVEIGLKSEAENFEDILQVNVSDRFLTSPKKSLSAFYWIRNSLQAHTTFYITTLDNCVVNINTVVKFLLDHQDETAESVHCGYMFEKDTAVIRGSGFRSISKELYPKKTYPPFCRQNLVILSFPFVKMIHEVSLSTNISGFNLEDVLLFGILREKLGKENSIKNIKNGGKPLVYYPWDETDKVLLKMKIKWKDWKRELFRAVSSSLIPK